jgi:antitoxin component of RelBE/YafQ-DinJ toxin-antitoxin module
MRKNALLQVRCDPTRLEEWQSVAERAGVRFSRWVVQALDRHAASTSAPPIESETAAPTEDERIGPIWRELKRLRSFAMLDITDPPSPQGLSENLRRVTVARRKVDELRFEVSATRQECEQALNACRDTMRQTAATEALLAEQRRLTRKQDDLRQLFHALTEFDHQLRRERKEIGLQRGLMHDELRFASGRNLEIDRSKIQCVSIADGPMEPPPNPRRAFKNRCRASKSRGAS